MDFSLWKLALIAFILMPNTATATNLTNIFQSFEKSTLLTILVEASDTNISMLCRTALKELKKGITNSDFWAMKMLDATGKISSGILDWSIFNYGSYDECLSILATSNVSENNTLSFVGQYCEVVLQRRDHPIGIPGVVEIRWDLCVPSLCSPQELNQAFASVSDFLVEVRTCSTQSAPTLNTYQIFSLVILSILAFLLIIGTLQDIVSRYPVKRDSENSHLLSAPVTKGKARIFLDCFSMYSNAIRLLDLKHNRIEVFNGLRVFSICWVVLVHVYILDPTKYGNGRIVYNQRGKFSFQLLNNAECVLDTFFLISGFLVVYSNIKKFPNINWFYFYIHRYLRLTPSVVFLILVTFLWPLMGSGPRWGDNIFQAVSKCQSVWWKNLIYINNYSEFNNQCQPHLWFLAVDMQLYIFSPIVLYSLWRWPIIGYSISGFIVLASVVITVGLTIINDLSPNEKPFENIDSKKSWTNLKYAISSTPLSRMAPYCMGMVLGYILTTKNRIDLSRIVQAILWCMASVLTGSAIFGVYSWYSGIKHSIYVNALYLSTFHIVWSLGIVWLIYACFHGYGGILNKFLSWRPYTFLAKLTYTTYISHFIIVLSFSGLLGARLMYNEFVLAVITLGLITLSFGASFFLCLCFEIPFQRLEEEFVRSSKNPHPTETLNLQVVNRETQ